MHGLAAVCNSGFARCDQQFVEVAEEMLRKQQGDRDVNYDPMGIKVGLPTASADASFNGRVSLTGNSEAGVAQLSQHHHPLRVGQRRSVADD